MFQSNLQQIKRASSTHWISTFEISQFKEDEPFAVLHSYLVVAEIK